MGILQIKSLTMSHIMKRGKGMTIKDGLKFGLGFLLAGMLFKLVYFVLVLVINTVSSSGSGTVV